MKTAIITSLLALASRPVVNSSKNTNSGLGIRAKTIKRRCRSQPDNSFT